MPTKQLTFSMKEYDRGGFVSVAEVAKKTSLSLATIYKEIESGRMVAYSLLIFISAHLSTSAG
ncbi:MAG TPA: hypothetical protein ENH94_02165, partial [Phycisphaerales bacterium]|nr:hypothetical protein [Phycisphaerales bacterium]